MLYRGNSAGECASPLGWKSTRIFNFINQLIMKNLLLTVIVLLFNSTTYAQPHCGDRVNAFTADFTCQIRPHNEARMNASINVGLSGSGKIAGMVGYRMYDMSVADDKGSSVKVFSTPVITLLVKQRFNGPDSRVLHSVGVTAGTKEYLEVSYRLYAAPNSRSFAVPGAIVSYNNQQGVMVGFVLMGLF